MDSSLFKQVMARWASGVTIVTTHTNDEYHGMTASSFSSVSLTPMLILICVGKNHLTHGMIAQSGIFAVNILESTQAEWGKRFAGIGGQVEDRFAGIAYTTAVTGAPILPGVVGWLDCRVDQAHDSGDHTIFVGEVLAANVHSADSEPLLYFNRHWGVFTPAQAPGLTHVVLFKLHEPSAENIVLIRDGLLSLKALIPQIRQIEVGGNVLPSERAYDLALTVRFESLAAMQEYQRHPDHLRVVNELIKPRAASIIAVDYEDGR